MSLPKFILESKIISKEEWNDYQSLKAEERGSYGLDDEDIDVAEKIIQKIRNCDDFHNRCDYLLEHDEITYLLEYIEDLKEWKSIGLMEYERPYAKKYLGELRKETPKLLYPDSERIYKDYYALKEKVEYLEGLRQELVEGKREIPEKLEEYIYTDSLNYNQCNYMFEKLTNKYNELIDYLKSKGE